MRFLFSLKNSNYTKTTPGSYQVSTPLWLYYTTDRSSRGKYLHGLREPRCCAGCYWSIEESRVSSVYPTNPRTHWKSAPLWVETRVSRDSPRGECRTYTPRSLWYATYVQVRAPLISYIRLFCTDVASGFLELGDRNYENAKSHFKALLSHSPMNSQALNNLAVCTFYEGDLREGVGMLEEAIHSSPEAFVTEQIVSTLVRTRHVVLHIIGIHGSGLVLWVWISRQSRKEEEISERM